MGSPQYFFKYGLLFATSATLTFAALIYFSQKPEVVWAAPPIVTNTIFLTDDDGTWEVPADWNNASNTIHAIGAGGYGGNRNQRGGGGGAYARITNLSLTPGQDIHYGVGIGEYDPTPSPHASSTYFNAASYTACSNPATCVRAAGGNTGGSGLGVGGTAANSVGTVKFSGGSSTLTPRGGGGGAAGPNGNGASTNRMGGGGANGGSAPTQTWNGGNNRFGTGGGPDVGDDGVNGGGGAKGDDNSSGGGAGGNGGNELLWTETSNFTQRGPGGGGGTGGQCSGCSPADGLWGGRGGIGGGGGADGGTLSRGGDGGDGLIVIQYAAPLAVGISDTSTSNNSCLSRNGFFRVYRTGSATNPAVQVTLSYSGATPGVDYESASTTVTIPANQFYVDVPITALGKSAPYTNSATLTVTIQPSSNYNIVADDEEKEITIQNGTLPIVLADVTSYTPAPFATYPYPGTSNDNSTGECLLTPAPGVGYQDESIFPSSCDQTGVSGYAGNGWQYHDYTWPMQPFPLLTNVKAGWYNGTPSPLTCFSATGSLQGQGQGKCLYIGSNKGTRIAAVTATAQFVATSTGPTNGLQAYWTLNSNHITTTVATDISGNARNGTIVNGPLTQVQGAFGDAGNARSFNGTTRYFHVADNNVFSPSVNDITISFWARVPTTAAPVGNGVCGGSGAYIVSKGIANGNWEWGIENDSNSRLCANFWQSAAGDEHVVLDTTRTINDNIWHHYVIVYDNPATSLYVDGALVDSASSVTGTMTNGTAQVRVGYREGSNYYNGSLDDVKIYNRALTPAEVTTLAGGALPPMSSGVDLVSTHANDACGKKVTRWVYETPAPTLKVPKNTAVQLTYACQPNQSYLWRTRRDYGGSAIANAVHQRIFRFADKAKVNNGTETSSLQGVVSTTVTGPGTLTLQCGGYQPELGTSTVMRPTYPEAEARDGFDGGSIPESVFDDFNTDWNGQGPFAEIDPERKNDNLDITRGLPPFYDLGNFRAGPNLGWAWTYWPWTWAFYNKVAPTYYHAPATITVEMCTGDHEIVVNGGECVACSLIDATKPYRIGNTCVGSSPPTVTTDPETSVTGNSATLNGSGNPNTFASTGWFRYSTTNPGTCNDTFGTRVPSSGGFNLGTGSAAVPYSQGISGLTPNTTYYYCAIASNSVGTGLGGIEQILTGGADICTDIGGNQTSLPTDCVGPLPSSPGTCKPTPEWGFDVPGNRCTPPAPANLELTVSPTRVRKGESTNLTWSGTNLPTAEGACVLTANPPGPSIPPITSGASGSTASIPIGPINQTTMLIMTCTVSGGAFDTDEQLIGTVPVFQEI